jgi:hypothetical protein
MNAPKFAAFVVLSVPALAQQASLVVTPISSCVGGRARVRVAWTAPNVPGVQVLAGQGQEQRPMTGLEPAFGAAESGDWVTDGMRFTLAAEDGRVLASATASIDCDGSGGQLRAALNGLGWLPLQVGNCWVYRSNSRQVTSSYYTRTITRTEQSNGRTWYVLDTPETLLRADGEGRIYELRDGVEELLLNPLVPNDFESRLRVQARTFPANTAFGTFPGSVDYQFTQSLRLEHGT